MRLGWEQTPVPKPSLGVWPQVGVPRRVPLVVRGNVPSVAARGPDTLGQIFLQLLHMLLLGGAGDFDGEGAACENRLDLPESEVYGILDSHDGGSVACCGIGT